MEAYNRDEKIEVILAHFYYGDIDRMIKEYPMRKHLGKVDLFDIDNDRYVVSYLKVRRRIDKLQKIKSKL